MSKLPRGNYDECHKYRKISLYIKDSPDKDIDGSTSFRVITQV